jgi:hypothetical protein
MNPTTVGLKRAAADLILKLIDKGADEQRELLLGALDAIVALAKPSLNAKFEAVCALRKASGGTADKGYTDLMGDLMAVELMKAYVAAGGSLPVARMQLRAAAFAAENEKGDE